MQQITQHWPLQRLHDLLINLLDYSDTSIERLLSSLPEQDKLSLLNYRPENAAKPLNEENVNKLRDTLAF